MREFRKLDTTVSYLEGHVIYAKERARQNRNDKDVPDSHLDYGTSTRKLLALHFTSENQIPESIVRVSLAGYLRHCPRVRH